MLNKLKAYQIHISIILLIIFYTVGIVGILTSKNPLEFLSLTPLNLMISLVLLFSNHIIWTKNQIIIFTTVAILGFFIEVLGVNTGLIFGEYKYGKTLGWKVFQTPLMIGINWILLTYSAVYSLKKHVKSNWLVAFFSSLILVLLDFLIEPVAITYDFWTWNDNNIPFQNYIAWYLIAFVFCLMIAKTSKESLNKMAPFLLLIQFIFFGILNFVIWN